MYHNNDTRTRTPVSFMKFSKNVITIRAIILLKRQFVKEETKINNHLT